MKIKELVPLAYSIHLYKEKDYDCLKYDFKIPSHMDRGMDLFFEKYKMNLAEYTIYDKQQAKVRLIISYFINNKNNAKNCTDYEYNSFINSLVDYKTNFELFFRKILSDNSLYNRTDIYKMLSKKEIPWYVFYFVQMFGKFPKDSLGSELIKESLKKNHKLVQFFKVFDIEYLKNIIGNMNNYINLSKV